MLPNSSAKDRQKIAGYLAWILYLYKLPFFLIKDVYRGDNIWLNFVFSKINNCNPFVYVPSQLSVYVYTDATPETMSIVCEYFNIYKGYLFHWTLSILMEGLAAFSGLIVVCKELQRINEHAVVNMYTNNMAIMYSFRKGKVHIFLYNIIRKMYFFFIIKYRNIRVTWSYVPSEANPADEPSRAILPSL
jgi:hypothetical protein